MKVVVFTAIFGEKVPIDIPGPFEKINDWDYILFTNFDADKFAISSWTIQKVDMPLDIPKYGKYIYANRFFKWHPHVLLKEYDIAIYVDGFQCPNIAYMNDWCGAAEYLINNNKPIFHCKHECNACIYKELIDVVKCQKDVAERTDIVKQFLLSHDYPHNLGLFWNGCYMLNIKHSQNIEKVWKTLWDDMIKFTYRDQTLLMFEYWKMGIRDDLLVVDLRKMIKNIDHGLNHMYV